jgi:HSP20 family protein
MAGTITQQEKAPRAEVAPKAGPLARAREFPFSLSRMREEFDRMFARFAAGFPTMSLGETMRAWRWGLDVMDKDNAIVVRAEAPGFEAGDFDIQVQDGQLTLRAARKSESKKEGEETWSSQEYYEAVILPPGIDKDKVQAKYRNGVLTVTLPKTPEGKGRRVTVEGA